MSLSAVAQWRPQPVGTPRPFSVHPRTRPDADAFLAAAAAAVPAAAPEPDLVSLKGLLDQVLRITHGSLQADAELCGAQISTPGFYDHVNVTILPGTHFETHLEVEHDAQGKRCLAGWIHFSQPLGIKNGVNAFVAPRGLWALARPLANWATDYAFTGITFGSGRPTLLQGRANLLGLHVGWLDHRISKAVAFARPPAEESSRNLCLALQALSNLGQTSQGAGCFSLRAHGNLPPEVPVNLSEQSFALVPGGPYHLDTGGFFDLRQPGTLDLRLESPSNQACFHSTALGFGLKAHATFSLEDRADQRLHLRSAGRMQLDVNRLALDVRAKDMADSGGIRIVGGEVRLGRPYAPALVAPVDFTYKRGVLNASGLLQLNAGATFVDPGEQPPAFEDDQMACDVKGTLDLSAIIPRLGKPQLPMKHRQPPDYAIRGVVSVRPPNSGPVYYRMDVTPLGPDFELEPDYTPPPSLLA